MKYALINNNVVENCIVGSPQFIEKIQDKYQYIIPVDGMTVGIGFTYENGEFIAPPVEEPEKTQEQIILEYTMSVQSFMDAKAQEYGYDDIKSAVTYADEPSVLKFQQEGIAFRQWRSLVWEKCYQVMNDITSGTRSMITVEELLGELPTLTIGV